MSVAGNDAHATYLVVAVVSHAEAVAPPAPIANTNAFRLVELLGRFRPLEAVVEPVQLGPRSMISSSVRVVAPDDSWLSRYDQAPPIAAYRPGAM